jgi:hypothetical protein
MYTISYVWKFIVCRELDDRCQVDERHGTLLYMKGVGPLMKELTSSVDEKSRVLVERC